MLEKNYIHKNHRKRLKEKVKNKGLDCLAFHEILELLLTYTIPRKDTNPIAHSLINKFGSFDRAVDADYHDLLKVEGVGPETALFLNVLSGFISAHDKSKQANSNIVLNSTTKCVEYFRNYYRIKSNEYMVLVCLSKSKRVVETCVYQGWTKQKLNFSYAKSQTI